MYRLTMYTDFTIKARPVVYSPRLVNAFQNKKHIQCVVYFECSKHTMYKLLRQALNINTSKITCCEACKFRKNFSFT